MYTDIDIIIINNFITTKHTDIHVFQHYQAMETIFQS